MPMLVQEYVNELAQSLVDTDKSPQDVVSAEKIKRLCNEAVRQGYLVLTAALTLMLCLHLQPLFHLSGC